MTYVRHKNEIYTRLLTDHLLRLIRRYGKAFKITTTPAGFVKTSVLQNVLLVFMACIYSYRLLQLLHQVSRRREDSLHQYLIVLITTETDQDGWGGGVNWCILQLWYTYEQMKVKCFFQLQSQSHIIKSLAINYVRANPTNSRIYSR